MMSNSQYIQQDTNQRIAMESGVHKDLQGSNYANSGSKKQMIPALNLGSIKN